MYDLVLTKKINVHSVHFLRLFFCTLDSDNNSRLCYQTFFCSGSKNTVVPSDMSQVALK